MVLGFLSSASPAVKWLGFECAVWVQAVAGNNYTFSNYSDALKSLMVLNQLQLNNLSVAKDVGKAFGILAGLVSDRLPISIILVVGDVEGLLGYGAHWLVVSQKTRPLPYWQEKGNTEADVECRISDSNGFWMCGDGRCISWIPLYRFYFGGDMPRSAFGHYGSCCIASELFGLKYYGLLYNILMLNLPLASFLFSGLLAGYLYDAQTTTSIDRVGNSCLGPHCYRLVFIIMAATCVFGFRLDTLLALWTKILYLKIHEIKKFNKYNSRSTSLK